MKYVRITAKHYALAAVILLLPKAAWADQAELAVNVDTSFYSKYPYIRFIYTGDPTKMSDEQFYAVAARVGFAINQTEPLPGDRFLTELKRSVLPRINADSLELTYMLVRGAASPDGSYVKNMERGEKRANWLFNFIRQQLLFPIDEEKFRLDNQVEDYRTLCLLMRQAGDKDYGYVKELCDRYLPADNIVALKTTLHSAQDGQLWRRLLKTYFPALRTARVVLFFKKYEGEKLAIAPAPAVALAPAMTPPAPAIEPALPAPVLPAVLPPGEEAVLPPEPAPGEPAPTLPRRELLAIKTNLLFYAAYIPGYDRWCPIPNVALEFFPKRGRLSFGASFDCPWWQDYDAHKYFQVNQYQVEARYYLGTKSSREADRASSPYRGLYLQAYGNIGVFGICFDANRGWVGEGYGGGLGVGYVTPLGRDSRWKLEFGLQAGLLATKYDPYQYENPVDPTYHDDLYYYKWTFDPALFKKRQYKWNWIGPTRIGVTLRYDLLHWKRERRAAL